MYRLLTWSFELYLIICSEIDKRIELNPSCLISVSIVLYDWTFSPAGT